MAPELFTGSIPSHLSDIYSLGVLLFYLVSNEFPVAGATLDVIKRAHAAGMGVIVKEALANGRLTARGDQPKFLAMAEERGVAPDALALAYVLSRPWVGVALSGAATAEQLASNLAARDVEWTENLEAGSRSLVIAPEAYWEQRSALAWN